MAVDISKMSKDQLTLAIKTLKDNNVAEEHIKPYEDRLHVVLLLETAGVTKAPKAEATPGKPIGEIINAAVVGDMTYRAGRAISSDAKAAGNYLKRKVKEFCDGASGKVALQKEVLAKANPTPAPTPAPEIPVVQPPQAPVAPQTDRDPYTQ